MKKSGRFESTLTAADDDYALIGEAGQILRFGGMCCECMRDVVNAAGRAAKAEMPPAMTTRKRENRFHPQA